MSALTGATVFMTLRSEDPTIGRVKGLNEQAKRFHEFHRRVHADLENREDLKVADYAAKIERDLNDITAGMSEPRTGPGKPRRRSPTAQRSLLDGWSCTSSQPARRPLSGRARDKRRG